MDVIAALPNEALGVEGVVDFSAGSATGNPVAASTEPGATGLTMVVGNPLSVPLDVQVRLASARNLATATERENANAFVENFDARWEMDIPHQIRHLEPGAKERWPMRLMWGGKVTDAVPAQVEFVVRWADPRDGAGRGEEGEPGGGGGGGGIKEIVLKRRVAVVPRAVVPLVGRVDMQGDVGWADAVQGGEGGGCLRGMCSAGMPCRSGVRNGR